jgi:sulfur carrier protein
MQIIIQPENKIENVTRVKTVMGLLKKLGFKDTQALVIRDNQLLTPDQRIYQDDRIIVRLVASRG